MTLSEKDRNLLVHTDIARRLLWIKSLLHRLRESKWGEFTLDDDLALEMMERRLDDIASSFQGKT